MNNPKFEEFSKVSAKEWKQKIQVDLKGADYNNTLIWHSNEGIDVKPFYDVEDLNPEHQLDIPKANQWRICQSIYVSDLEISNKKALEYLEKGATSIKFTIPNNDTDLNKLFLNLNLSEVEIHIQPLFLSLEFALSLDKFAKESNGQIYLHSDCIGHLSKSGNWFHNFKDDLKNTVEILKSCHNLKSNLSINLELFQNAGANMVQQLAYSIAQGFEYINAFGEEIKTTITFNVSVGSNYFFEIAKLKALRLLWHSIASDAKLANTNCHILATPSKRNKTLYDYNTNMLRTTTECMSAILGGANTVSNLPYDFVYHKTNDFAERITRNQLLILKHESYFDKVSNPTDGSYYIESLTHQLAEKALGLFKDIETQGGYLKLLKEGIIQKKIKESADQELQQFEDGKEILLGTNIHPNPEDKMKDDIQLYPFLKMNPRKTLLQPILEKRLAERMEQNRLNDE
ncbi:MAG: methylmalonyl-CoA mutase [Bacteroidetes bacterium MedPE-SWsnd-G2]|nr:MAG: methylmalonyl-CoA mutase [Bacteroidetes bacterium MedPE-SWsnd-G2]